MNRLQVTFRSTPEGEIGILQDRPVIVVSAHGGYRGERPPGQPDFLSLYLETIFATIGIHTLLFLRLEGMSRGPEAVTGALAKARAWIEDELPNLIGPMAVRPQR